MGFPITDNLRQALRKNEITPVLVAKIDGREQLLTNISIQRYIRIGDPGLVIGNDWFIGGTRALENQDPFITFNTGTTTKITQKLDPSRGQGSSTSQMVLSLVDKNEKMTELVSPGFELTEIMGRDVTVYSGLADTSWPEDYNIIFRGVVQGVDNGSGYVNLLLSNTEEKKRTAILDVVRDELVDQIDYRSGVFQSLFFKNRPDVPTPATITYTGGGTAGSEGVTVVGYTITVQIQSGVSTANQIRKAIENNASANQILQDIEIAEGFDGSDPQTTGSLTLVITDEFSTASQVAHTQRFIDPRDCIRTYLRIDDELIETDGGTAGSFFVHGGSAGRAQENTEGAIHEVGTDAIQMLRITENAITLALKLLLSPGPEFYVEDYPVDSIIYYNPSTNIPNALIFKGVDLVSEYGVCVGDSAAFQGSATNPLLDNVFFTIEEIGMIDGDTYIITPFVALNPEIISTATLKIASQFNVLPIGVGLLPKDVDVKQHLYIRDTYLPNAPIDIFVDSIPNGKDFIEQQIYLPYSCFSVPRKGRSSVCYHIGPLPTDEVLQLNLDTVKNPEALVIKRSLSENFFNQVVFSYDKDVLTGEYRTIDPYDSEESQALMPGIGVRPFEIPANGFRTADGAQGFAQRTAARFLKRYQYGAEFIKGVRVTYDIGYRAEIGDIVAVDFSSLKLGDSGTGTRSGPIKLFEILNKVIDNKTGDVSLDIVNTIFQTDDRFGLIAPSTRLDAGSTTTKLIMKKSFGTRSFEKESYKWRNIIDRDVLVHNEDWSIVYPTVIRGFDDNDPQGMTVDALPGAPSENWYVDIPRYPDIDDKDLQAFFKNRYAFFAPQVFLVATSGSNFEFEVDPADIDKFFIGATVKVHNEDYSANSDDTTVIDVDTGTNIVTVRDDLGFLPDADCSVELIGFKDKQPAYRIT